MVDTRSRFLELPVELRLLIYGFAVLDARVVTVSTAKLTGSPPDIVYRQFGASRSPFSGIPLHSEPVIETQFNANLLSGKAAIEVSPSTADPLETCTSTPYQSLLRLNRQINREIKGHFAVAARRQTSLFVNYPHGLHVLQTTSPELLKQSRSVHISGSHVPRINARRTGYAANPEIPEKLQGDVPPDTVGQLSQLVKEIFEPDVPHPVEKLELRIYYPGDSYAALWGDDNSPICVALRNIGLGKIDMVVWRGSRGNGIHLTATPVTERKRIISTVWRRLDEGGTGQPEAGAFAIDPKWPSWETEDDPTLGGTNITF